MELKVTPIFEKLWRSKKRIIIQRGGTRSSKTYSTAQFICVLCIKYPGIKVVVARGTLTSARKTVIEDIRSVIASSEAFNDFEENKSDFIFRHKNTSTIHIIGCDDEMKIRGLEANVVWMEEANEINFDFFKQFILRLTSKKVGDRPNQIILSFNPSSPKSWIKTQVEDMRTDYTLIKSSYLDNPFLSAEAIREIELLKETDPDAWKIYGQGEYCEIKGAIYNRFLTTNNMPDGDVYYGLDWGYSTDPTSLVKVIKHNDSIYVEQLIYERAMTNSDIIEKLKFLGLNQRDEIVADSAEPKSIEELRRAGFNIKPVTKGPDSIKNGIDIIKRYDIKILENLISHNLLDELYNYKWKVDKDGNNINQPVDKYNHSLDAIRYVALMKYTNGKKENRISIF